MEENKDIFILLGCEESQAVTIEFRKLGFQAFSCDLQECSGGHPEWHFQLDIFEVIKGGLLVTQSGELVEIRYWSLGIFFPPCTFLTVTANKWYKEQPKRKSGTLVGEERYKAREDAVKFFKDLYESKIPRIAIENPIGVMSTEFKLPSQIIQPYYFGDKSRKSTCLWLKHLPMLYHTKRINLFDKVITHVEPDIYTFKNGKGTCSRDYMVALSQKEDRAKIRSKTFPGIANAMAEQWGEYLIYKINQNANK